MIKAELVDSMGSDLTVVNSARVSFSKHKDVIDSGDEKLIKYLSKHNHWTPFSHPVIQMRETVPIFVARQRFKHTVGFTYNEVSRRYVDDTPEFYSPDVWRSVPDGSIKQGSGGRHINSDIWASRYNAYIHTSIDLYDEMISDGVAPEQARAVLPQSMLTSYYVTGSLASWGRAYKQRVDSHAQLEIQELGHQWGKILEPLFPISWKELSGVE